MNGVHTIAKRSLRVRKASGGRHIEEEKKTWSVQVAKAIKLREMGIKTVEDRAKASAEWEPRGSRVGRIRTMR